MPSSLNLNGLKYFRPAVYAEVDASALGGQDASTGNVCLVGSFPSFEKDAPLTFTSAQALSRYDHSDRELAHIGRVAFAPSRDERIPAGANTLTMLNVAPSTQAQATVQDSDSVGTLVLKSTVWGDKGNRTQVEFTTTGSQVSVSAVRDGASELFEEIESGDVASIYYDGTALSVVQIDADRVNGVEYIWSQEVANNDPDDVDVSDMVPNGTLSVALDNDANAVDVVITGADLDGVAVTETVSFPAGSGNSAATYTNASFGRIDSISLTSNRSGSVHIRGSKTLAVSSFNDLRELISALDQFPNVVATYSAGKTYEADAFDSFESLDIIGASDAVSVRCDLAEILLALSSSRLITAERAVGSVDTVDPSLNTPLMLTGGGSTPATLSDWTQALETVESADIQIVVPWSGDANYHAEVAKHLRASALAGRERNAWVGADANESLSQLKVRATSLNDRNVALVGQQVKVVDPLGNTVTKDPIWLALMLACMQAGSPVATPLTRKQPDVLDVLSASSWNANKDAREAILSGVVALTFGPLGWRIERSVTTWRRDDNPIYSEVSANESVNASIRDLRAGLDRFIGQANRSLTANRIKSIVESRLNRQVLDGTIKAFKDIVLEDLGDTLNVTYTVSAVEPINFIRITASVARF